MTEKQQARCIEMENLVGKTISGGYKDGTPFPKEGIRIICFVGLPGSDDPDADHFCFSVVHAHPLIAHATFRILLPYQVAIALIDNKTKFWRGHEFRILSCS